jgi:phycocyanin-associated, rod
MFGQTTVGTGGISTASSRMFRYEVTGLRQNSENDKNSYEIRNSGSVYEMQRITRMGGTIVKIEPLTAQSALGADNESQGHN